MKKDTLYYIGCLTLILAGFIGLLFWIPSENAKIERDNLAYTEFFKGCADEFVPQMKKGEMCDGYVERYNSHMVACLSNTMDK